MHIILFIKKEYEQYIPFPAQKNRIRFLRKRPCRQQQIIRHRQMRGFGQSAPNAARQTRITPGGNGGGIPGGTFRRRRGRAC